jgi:hypothetical protein
VIYKVNFLQVKVFNGAMVWTSGLLRHRRECSESLSATENFCFVAGDVQLPMW